MVIFSEKTPLLLRLLCSAFAVLGGVGLFKIAQGGVQNSNTSWFGVAVLCLLVLGFLSTWFLKVAIRFDAEKRQLIVNRSGWKERYLASDISDVFYVHVGGFLASSPWSVRLKVGPKESWLVGLHSEEAAKTLIRDIRVAIALPVHPEAG